MPAAPQGASLREAIEQIAKQHTSAELQAVIDAESAQSSFAASWHATAELADFRGGYDQCIEVARAALSLSRPERE